MRYKTFLICIILLFASLPSVVSNKVSSSLGNLFFVNGTSGFVGIGTTVPNAKLEVSGTGTLLDVKNNNDLLFLVNEISGEIKIGI